MTMHQTRPPPRGPGTLSPLAGTATSSSGAAPLRPTARRVESSSSDDNSALPALAQTRQQQPPNTAATAAAVALGAPHYPAFTSHANSSSTSLQNFSRPTVPPNTRPANDTSPLSPRAPSGLTPTKGHHRKHSQTQGHFEAILPSTATSSLSQVGMAQPAPPPTSPGLSQIAAQAAVASHQTNTHTRQRSQTVPGGQTEGFDLTRRTGGNGGPNRQQPLNPPMLSLTEASAPRDSAFSSSQGYHNTLLGGHSSAATAAANVVFTRSGPTSPLQPSHSAPAQAPPPPPPLPPPVPEKSYKAEKTSKVKLFSRPRKISTKGDTDERPLPSPGKIGSALSALQRGNFSTASLVDNPALYNMANSSSATIRPLDIPGEKEGKEKEKKLHFLSRQKHKLKEEYHLSSASSNSRPSLDLLSAGSVYNFNLPPSPAPTTTSFTKGMASLDLRHGVRRDRRNQERSESRLDPESAFGYSEWPGSSSLTTLSNQSSLHLDPAEPNKLGSNAISLDDAWPFLKAKLLVIFEGEDLRHPVEDLNRVVTMHIQYCIQRRSPNIIVDDLRELLEQGFSSLDRTLRHTPEDRLIPALVELWLFTFTSILPYTQSVFLPLDLEFAGRGTLMTRDQARDFWGGVVDAGPPSTGAQTAHVSPADTVLDVRRLVLVAYRDTVILPRYEKLKTIFSRLSLEFLPSSLASMALAPPSDAMLSTSPTEGLASMARPGTAMSLDPSVASYNSSSTTLFGEGSATGNRSRAISNVSYASGTSDGANPSSAPGSSFLRPFTPNLPTLGNGSSSGSASGSLGSLRDQNVEDSKQVTELAGRMLQCTSVLASIGAVGEAGDEGNRKMEELCRLLKLNWLGRGRTGRNRRGIVGGRVRREEVKETVSVI